MISFKPAFIARSGRRPRSRRLLAAVTVVLGLAAMIPAARGGERLVIGDFDGASSEEALPTGWEPLFFKDIEIHSSYSRDRDDGRGVIRATSAGGASGLVRKLNIDAARLPVITWQWKVSGVLDKGDVFARSGDDYPARIYITFAYDPATAGVWDKLSFNTVKLLYGEYPPAAALSYIWANKAEPGLVVPNAYTDRVVMFVVRSGAERAGQWFTEKRNIVDDYRRAFNREPPPISGIAIMTDTDNTGESVTAWYGDIILSSE